MLEPTSNADSRGPTVTNAQVMQGVWNRLVLPSVAIVLVLWNGLMFLSAWYRMPANDFGRIFHSAVAFTQGRDMYAWSLATPARIEEGGYALNLYNMNPPHLHLPLLPLTALAEDYALAVWWVLSGLCLFICLRRILNELNIELTPENRRLGLLCMLAFSGTAAFLATAQLSFILLVPITWMWLASRHGQWGRAGVWLGLALSVKPFLAVVLAFFAFRRHFRAAFACLATVGAAFALGWLVFGRDNFLSWQHKLSISDGWAWLPMNASLMAFLTRSFAESIWFVPIANLSPAMLWLSWLAVGGIMGIVTLLATTDDATPEALDRNLMLALTSSVMLSPLGWIYYLWLLLPPGLALWQAGWPFQKSESRGQESVRIRWTRPMMWVAAAAFVWPIIGTRVFQPDGQDIRAGLFAPETGFHLEAIATLFIGNTYFWGLLLFWVCLTWEAAAFRKSLSAQLPELAPENYRVSVVMPVYSETDTVPQITGYLMRELGARLEEIIIIQSPRSSEVSRSICRRLAEEHPRIRLFMQENNPGLGNAVREGLARVRGNVVLMMDSDGEMENDTVPRLLEEMARGDFALVAAARWLPGGGFTGYGGLKYYLNWYFQQMFRWLFWTKLHDLTYGFKLMRAELARGLTWEGTLHEIACETTLKPVRLGLPVSEVPSKWTARTQGASKNTFWRNFRYVRTALKILLGRIALPSEPAAQARRMAVLASAAGSAAVPEPADHLQPTYPSPTPVRECCHSTR